ncbi:polysaccharide pyruvyl transferase family protein [Lacrimispora sphenoides]|uniref:Polysaccharide pyruvyl transferase n=1 Tax=Lacrimispora sphenoides JCM 1415 TaxID=1297793 RepID=A0ABY1CHT7_9FIRM|nr:polysaccharide pyruvyl transferase family protein [Lacrimispora sphenoides]SEU05587.1 Polysaccharide pyruvyl transferase [[Clostridium] sphenoides JCM 1415]SUY49024.1 polysaccharide pyruvyl transferase [Lacrimispora sphenoides]
MKICILSMQSIVNYGSVLQAYALRRLLQNLGHEVDFIDIQGDGDSIPEIDYSNDNMRCNLMYLYHRLANHLQRKKIKEFQIDVLELNETNNLKEYDVCVIGSDEVFNCNQKSSWGFSMQLFGKVTNAKKVITYAASCGQTSFEQLTDDKKEKIKCALRNLNAISVRDKNTMDFVNAFGYRQCNYSLDPTLVYDFSKDLSISSTSKGKYNNICLIYAYQDRISDPREISYIKEFCKKKGLRIVAAGAYQSWLKEQLYLKPFKLLEAFSQADFVITDTFHGAIFSIKYTERFAILVRDGNRNKLQDLVERLGVKNHRAQDISDLDKIYGLKKETDTIESVIAMEKEKSYKYLKEQI